MQARVAVRKIQGQRARQEDACLSIELAGGQLLLLADGLGGHACGDVASQEAIRAFSHYLTEARSALQSDPAHTLRFALMSAHHALEHLQRAMTACENMATTLVAAWVAEQRLHYVSVGDSHLLLIRNGSVQLRNRLHGQGNQVSSCLGYYLTDIDTGSDIELQAGDRLLLASDGIESLGLQQWAQRACAAAEPDELVDGLLDELRRVADPRQDNCSLIALAI